MDNLHDDYLFNKLRIESHIEFDCRKSIELILHSTKNKHTSRKQILYVYVII